MDVLKQALNFKSFNKDYLPQPCRAKASAAGKAILCGEHAVVYGATAVAMPLKGHEMHATLTVPTDRAPGSVSMVLGEHQVSEHIASVVRDAFDIFGIEPFPVIIEGRSQLPIGAGLGSSATLCVVITKAIAAAIGASLTADQVAFAANHLEKRFHGRPSGLDTSVVAHEKVISFRVGHSATPLVLKGRWRFALIDSQIRASTLTMIKKAEPYFTGAEGSQRIQAFDRWSQTVVRGLTHGVLEDVAGGMEASGAMLKEAGVVPDQLDDILRLSRQHGALAAKITGSGGGGSLLVLLPSDARAARSVCDRIRQDLPGQAIFEVEI